VILGLDVGSTMAKAVLADARSGAGLFQAAYSNAGDTIETVKRVFSDLRERGLSQVALRGIGITGSARYQVEQALTHIYPALEDRIAVLVENYAHARGSLEQARQHIRRLKGQGHAGVNEQFCILIDIGGEDTKVSTIALEQAELFDNAMNLKCSAGTGSLMDTLSAMFGIGDTAAACAEAYAAPRAFGINASCAVFLMENASKLQAQGVPRDQILASANWAIVENMARSLWNQLELPGEAVVLLHRQTMCSEPLPLAVTHRLQSYLGRPAYALIPPSPGHRACIGLIHTLMQTAPPGFAYIRPADFIDTGFEKRVIVCKGTACGDPDARGNRCALRCRSTDGGKFSFTLGGCTAINELLGRKARYGEGAAPPRDAYKEIWDFIDARHPRSEDPRRLVIPRSFVVSEWAYLLARFFEPLGIPVHVDTVRETDLTAAQPDFNVDTCAPQIGAVGQYRRLDGEPHGIILCPADRDAADRRKKPRPRLHDQPGRRGGGKQPRRPDPSGGALSPVPSQPERTRRRRHRRPVARPARGRVPLLRHPSVARCAAGNHRASHRGPPAAAAGGRRPRRGFGRGSAGGKPPGGARGRARVHPQPRHL
jgi:activator of 2-hydroxyglutaryl-CoA dehydratase